VSRNGLPAGEEGLDGFAHDLDVATEVRVGDALFAQFLLERGMIVFHRVSKRGSKD
jgi:hypothetical protein